MLRSQHATLCDCDVTKQLELFDVDIHKPLLLSQPQFTLHRIMMDVRAAPGSPHVFVFTSVCSSERKVNLLFLPDNTERALLIQQYLYTLVAAHAEFFAVDATAEFMDNLESCFMVA